MLGLAESPDARDGRKVVRSNRADRVMRPVPRVALLEPQQPVRKRTLGLELLAHHGLDEA
jgi:hypothetical protein